MLNKLKMKLSLLFVAVGFSIQAFAQSPVAKKYAEYITAADAKKHLTIIASDEFEGRETGTRGAKKAADYIAAEFKKLALKAPVKGSFFQDVPLVEAKFNVTSFIANQQSFTYGKQFYFTGNPEQKNIKVNEVVFAGYGITTSEYDDLKNIDISGKVVVVIGTGEPFKNGISHITKTEKASEWARGSEKRISNLLSKNPSLILVVSPEVEPLLQKYQKYFTEGQVKLKSKAIEAPESKTAIINISPEIADQIFKKSGKKTNRLKSEIDQSGKPQSSIIKADFETAFKLERKDLEAVNVLGYLEGSDLKDELVVVSAHYDHEGLATEGVDKVYNGADDDGSGTTAVLEIAKAFSKAKADGKGPRRSILFLGNVGEEKGLLGSEWYSDNPVFPLEKTITNLNIDMIGRVDSAHQNSPEYCYLIGSDKLSSDLHKISENANATYTNLKIDYKYNDPNDPERIYYRSDHYNFAKHNIPIIFYFNGVHEDYHKPSDEVDKINFALLTKRTHLVFYTSWELVNRDKRPEVDVKNNLTESR